MARVRLLIVSFIVILLDSCQGEVIITDLDGTTAIAQFRSMAASFGKAIPKDGIRGFAIQSSPPDGCSKMTNAPHSTESTNWFAVISRYGGCTFEEKVRNAGNANFTAAIVYNKDSNKVFRVIPMGGNDEKLIPSVFIGYTSGHQILAQFTHEKNPNISVWIMDDEPFDINAYLLPFAIVVGICFLVMLAIVLYKCIQDHRRRIRHRLPKSALKKLPIHKFKVGDPFETCCICLDDFEEGDKLRILPCDHGYHYKCIDPWLVKNKRICPQCRKRVFDRGSGYSGDSDSDDNQTNNERAPLIRPSTSRSTGGTFGGPMQEVHVSTMERLQNPTLTTQSDPSRPSSSVNWSDQDTSRQSSTQNNHRRLRRARRLRRVYEALTESESDDDGEPEVQNETAEGQDAHSENQSIASSDQPQQHVSAEIHVQVHEDHDDHDEEESPYDTHQETDVPQVVVTSRSPGSDEGAEHSGAENA